MTSILSVKDFPNICRLCSMKKENLKLMEHSLDLGILKNITDIKVSLLKN